MKVLVIGAGGFTGSYLFNIIRKKYEVVGTSTHNKGFLNLDISKFGKTYKLLAEINPDVICLPAGITNLDYIEKHPVKSREVNVLGTKNIVDYCHKNNCKLVFFSSDAVFDGKNGPYTENARPNPISEYGKQKLEAEKFIEKLGNFAIIRTSSVYGWDKRNFNFVSRMIDALKNSEEFKAPIDQFYTPTYVVDLADAAFKIIEKKFNGIFNISGPDFINRYDIALDVCKIFGFKKEFIIPVKSSQLNQMAKRPRYGGLNNKKAIKTLGIKLRGIKEGIRDMQVNKIGQ